MIKSFNLKIVKKKLFYQNNFLILKNLLLWQEILIVKIS